MLKHKVNGVCVPVVPDKRNVAVVHLKEGQKVSVTEATDKCKKPPYYSIYGGTYMNSGEKNLLQQIGEMNAAEQWFFLYVEARLDYATNTATVLNADLTPYQIGAKTRAFKSLHAKKLMKRVKYTQYMISPHIIIPLGTKPNGNEIYPDLVDIWDSLE